MNFVINNSKTANKAANTANAPAKQAKETKVGALNLSAVQTVTRVKTARTFEMPEAFKASDGSQHTVGVSIFMKRKPGTKKTDNAKIPGANIGCSVLSMGLSWSQAVLLADSKAAKGTFANALAVLVARIEATITQVLEMAAKGEATVGHLEAVRELLRVRGTDADKGIIANINQVVPERTSGADADTE